MSMDGKGFIADFEELCKRYSVDDYALVIRTVAGDAAMKWDVKNFFELDEASVRQRFAGLYFDVSGIQKVIIDYSWKRPELPIQADDSPAPE